MLSRPAVAQAMHVLGAQFTPAVAQAMLAKETALMATVQAYGDTFLLATAAAASLARCKAASRKACCVQRRSRFSSHTPRRDGGVLEPDSYSKLHQLIR